MPLTAEQLDGLTAAYVDGLQPADDTGSGALRVGLKHPEAMPILLQATSEATRKAVEIARVSRCPDNVERLAEIVGVSLPIPCDATGRVAGTATPVRASPCATLAAIAAPPGSRLRRGI